MTVTKGDATPAVPRAILDDITRDLGTVAAESADAYRAAMPFPHTSFDGLFSDDLLDHVVEEIDRQDGWMQAYSDVKSPGKKIVREFDKLGPYTQRMFSLLTSSPMVRFIEQFTGIPRLIPDPHLHSGGLHHIGPGGRLEMHTDFNFSGDLRLFRRINVLLYLNRDWKDEWGGDLQLWDRKMSTSVSFPPRFNRLVLAHVLPDGLHGVGEVKCPEGNARKSIALWYYTAELPVHVQNGYDLCEPNFIEREGDQGTPLPRSLWRWILPPWAIARIKRHRQCFTYSPLRVRSAITRFLPPMIVRAYQWMMGRR
ncbi:MAG: 2OG-Fe(II) oxygenase [Planctomycetota bacterium]